jgi:hypothetical protein
MKRVVASAKLDTFAMKAPINVKQITQNAVTISISMRPQTHVIASQDLFNI